MPACSQYDPKLPHSTETEKNEWLLAWTKNVGLSCTACKELAVCKDPKNETDAGECLACVAASPECESEFSQCSTCIAKSASEGKPLFDTVFGCTNDSSALSTGAIVGIVLGSVAFVLFILLVLLLWYWKKHPSSKSKNDSKKDSGIQLTKFGETK